MVAGVAGVQKVPPLTASSSSSERSPVTESTSSVEIEKPAAFAISMIAPELSAALSFS